MGNLPRHREKVFIALISTSCTEVPVQMCIILYIQTHFAYVRLFAMSEEPLVLSEE